MTTPQTTPELPTLPQSLINTIGEYGMARTDKVSPIELTHRWQLLIAGIKDYAASVLAARVTAAPQEGVSETPVKCRWEEIKPGLGRFVPIEDAAPPTAAWQTVGSDGLAKTTRIPAIARIWRDQGLIVTTPNETEAPKPFSDANIRRKINSVAHVQEAVRGMLVDEILSDISALAALPPPGRGMVPMTEDEAVVCVAQVLPVISSGNEELWHIQHKHAVKIVRAVEAAHGIKEGS